MKRQLKLNIEIHEIRISLLTLLSHFVQFSRMLYWVTIDLAKICKFSSHAAFINIY